MSKKKQCGKWSWTEWRGKRRLGGDTVVNLLVVRKVWTIKSVTCCERYTAAKETLVSNCAALTSKFLSKRQNSKYQALLESALRGLGLTKHTCLAKLL